MVVGNGMNEKTEVGPLVNHKAVDKVVEQIEDAQKKGAKVLYGGNAPAGEDFEKGSFFLPTVLVDVKDEHANYV